MSDFHKGRTKYNSDKTLLNGLNSLLITKSDYNLITEYTRERKVGTVGKISDYSKNELTEI
ncbi:MAG: hypothetical protein U9N40_08630 [Euryarchaeota archaeon]|nr:hypothetical protein [Euryarchaeota archaeon]